jgi:hypothetical protein
VLRVTFDRKVRLEFYGTKVTSDTGLLAYRELDEALGLTKIADGICALERHGAMMDSIVTFPTEGQKVIFLIISSL